MKQIMIDDELYQFLASKTEYIGESASSILRRLLQIEVEPHQQENITADNNPSQLSDLSPLLTLINSSEFLNEKKLINRFLTILSHLYLYDPLSFTQAAHDLKGSKRVYITLNREDLVHSGKTTKPRQIPDTPFWVVTNNNSARKVLIVENLMNLMKVDPTVVELVKHQMNKIGK